ncbi:MAG: PQQ-binding-like beta-propeller repeat protein [Polyangiaceae bacterium]
MYRTDLGLSDPILVTAFNSYVFGLDRQSGQPLWSHKLAGQSSTVELALLENVVVALDQASLTFLEYATGRLLGSVTLAGGGTRATMLIDGPHVYVARSGEVACYTSHGNLVWLQPFKGFGYGAVAMALPGGVRQADDIGRS